MNLTKAQFSNFGTANHFPPILVLNGTPTHGHGITVHMWYLSSPCCLAGAFLSRKEPVVAFTPATVEYQPLCTSMQHKNSITWWQNAHSTPQCKWQSGWLRTGQ